MYEYESKDEHIILETTCISLDEWFKYFSCPLYPKYFTHNI